MGIVSLSRPRKSIFSEKSALWGPSSTFPTLRLVYANQFLESACRHSTRVSRDTYLNASAAAGGGCALQTGPGHQKARNSSLIRFWAFMLAVISLSLLPIILQATSPTDLFPPQKSGCQWCCHCAATTASPFCMPMMTLSNWHHYTWLGIWLCLNWLCSNLEQLCVNIELGVRFLLSVPLKQTCPETATVPVLVCFTEGDNGTSKHVKKKINLFNPVIEDNAVGLLPHEFCL